MKKLIFIILLSSLSLSLATITVHAQLCENAQNFYDNLQAHFLELVPPAPSSLDLNSDGVINVLDYSLFANSWWDWCPDDISGGSTGGGILPPISDGRSFDDGIVIYENESSIDYYAPDGCLIGTSSEILTTIDHSRRYLVASYTGCGSYQVDLWSLGNNDCRIQLNMYLPGGLSRVYELTSPVCGDTSENTGGEANGDDVFILPVENPYISLPVAGSPTPIEDATVSLRVSETTGTIIRSGPGETYPVIAVVPFGNYLEVTTKVNDWYGVIWEGNTGWVHSSAVTEIIEDIEPDISILDVPPAPPCPDGTGPGGVVAGDYPPQRLTQEQRQWLYNVFGNQGTAPVGYGGERCGESYNDSFENFVALVCRMDISGPGGIRPGGYVPQDLTQEQRQWLWDIFETTNDTAPVGYGGQNCPSDAEVRPPLRECPTGTGPNGITGGSYPPQDLTQEQRQWLWESFGHANEGQAPVGYGGEECSQTPSTAEPLPQCPMGIGPGGITAGNYQPQELTQEQRQWLFNTFGNEGEAPIGYGGQGCATRELTVREAFIAEVCEQNYTGLNGLRPGSYNPQDLSAEQRAWLWLIFGNPPVNDIPIGYGGERCPGQTENYEVPSLPPVTTEEPITDVVETTVDVRATPSVNAPISGSFPADEYRVVGKSASNYWIQVEYSGQSGWICRNLVTESGIIFVLPVTDTSSEDCSGNIIGIPQIVVPEPGETTEPSIIVQPPNDVVVIEAKANLLREFEAALAIFNGLYELYESNGMIKKIPFLEGFFRSVAVQEFINNSQLCVQNYSLTDPNLNPDCLSALISLGGILADATGNKILGAYFSALESLIYASEVYAETRQ